MAKLNHKGNGHETETPDVSHIKNDDVVHETSDVNVPALLKFVLALTVMTAAVYILMLLLFNFLNQQEARNEPPAGPMAMTEQESLPPEPRLQSAPGFGEDLAKSVGDPGSETPKDPLWEIRVLREQWDRALKEGPRDQAGRPVGIPIEQAMRQIVEGQTLKSRATATPQAGGYGDSAPTAASAGRVSMKAVGGGQ